MAYMNAGGNFNDVISGLSAIKRRAQITGRPITNNDVLNMQEPLFAANREYAPAARELEERKRQALLDLQQREEMAADQKKAGLMQTGVNAVGTGMTAYNMMKTPADGEPGIISKAGTKIKDFVLPAKESSSVIPAAGAETTLNVLPETAALDGSMVTTTGDVATDAGIDTSATLIGEQAGGSLASNLVAGLGSVASYAPYVAAAKLLGTGTRMLTGDQDGNKMDYFSRTGRIAEQADKGLFKPLQKEVGGVPESIQPFVDAYHNIHNPAGYLLERAGCIIVTACTDRYSAEVDIARQYRDTHLDGDQMRGYYWLAEKIVPMLEQNDKTRQTCKKWLVDRLIEHGAHKLGLREERPRLSSVVVSKAFLAAIKIIGLILPVYVRKNGEVY